MNEWMHDLMDIIWAHDFGPSPRKGYIDARDAVGVPCITTLPTDGGLA